MRQLRHNDAMSPKHEYSYVVNRMASFFMPRNHTNVRALHIFGY